MLSSPFITSMQEVKPAHVLSASGTVPHLMASISAGDTGCAAGAGCPTEAGDIETSVFDRLAAGAGPRGVPCSEALAMLLDDGLGDA